MEILLIAALIPPLFLMVQVYRTDKIEREPVGLIVKLFLFGIISVIPTGIVESLADSIVMQGIFAGSTSAFARFIQFFFLVALVEEFFKYIFLKIGSWRNPAFDYVFDAVVYSAAVALGFAAFENIGYVFSFGIEVAGLRAVTAIPGHCIFGIFMGHYYGLAKMAEKDGNEAAKRGFLTKALWIPVLLHGFYDFAASSGSEIMTIVFFAFVVALDVVAIRRVREYSKSDTMIDRGGWH